MDDFVTPDVFAEAFGKPEQDGDAEIAGNDDDTPARWKRVRPSERDFMETCIEEVEAMSDEKALQRFCTNNDRSWVFWSSRRGNQPEKDQFMTRAVGLWWPWKMFEEMQGRSIVCPKCERSISRAKGTWVPLDEVREVISFSSTWLLLGREYRCPAANCNASFRNTGERFLKQCPELTRLRFSIILRRRLAIERAVAQFIHPLWVTNAQAAFDLLLGAHVREYERVREAYLLHWSIWKGTPVKLDAFRWLARWGPIMQVEKSHILRKLFIRAMSDALFVPDESLLREKTPNGDFCQMTRELRSETPRKVPQPSILKERVRAVLIMFVNSDSLAERQNRINFLYRVCPSDT
ncbi:Hypothetical Protein FCC1311_074492, partial [Hondaea fermentalgiana]